MAGTVRRTRRSVGASVAVGRTTTVIPPDPPSDTGLGVGIAGAVGGGTVVAVATELAGETTALPVGGGAVAVAAISPGRADWTALSTRPSGAAWQAVPTRATSIPTPHVAPSRARRRFPAGNRIVILASLTS